jgi:hypothetical protein
MYCYYLNDKFILTNRMMVNLGNYSLVTKWYNLNLKIYYKIFYNIIIRMIKYDMDSYKKKRSGWESSESI